MCRLLGIGSDTLRLWAMIYPEFSAAMRAHTDARSERVEAALFQRAVGYEQPGEKLFYDKDSGVQRVAIVNHIPADPLSAREWLRVHRPETYNKPDGQIQQNGSENKLIIELKNSTGLPNMRDPTKQPEGTFAPRPTEDEL
jgi:hypothetical protein